MEACRFTPQTPLVTTRGALQEIPADAAEPIALAQIDFCLVPGLLFDPYGTRLGYGAGYYDRFLPKLSEDCTILAAGFDCQLVGSRSHTTRPTTACLRSGRRASRSAQENRFEQQSAACRRFRDRQR